MKGKGRDRGALEADTTSDPIPLQPHNPVSFHHEKPAQSQDTQSWHSHGLPWTSPAPYLSLLDPLGNLPPASLMALDPTTQLVSKPGRQKRAQSFANRLTAPLPLPTPGGRRKDKGSWGSCTGQLALVEPLESRGDTLRPPHTSGTLFG